jgi:hypothetical protein
MWWFSSRAIVAFAHIIASSSEINARDVSLPPCLLGGFGKPFRDENRPVVRLDDRPLSITVRSVPDAARYC